VFFGPEKVKFTVEGDVLEIVFPMPDCVFPFQKTTAWGWSEGCPIRLSLGDHHCQARLIAKPTKPNCHLRREGEFLEFVETRLSKPRDEKRLKDWKGLPHSEPFHLDLQPSLFRRGGVKG